MNRIYRAASCTLFAINLFCGCGEPETIAMATQAYSLGLPPKSTQPWICSPSSWNPVDGQPSSQWPAHGWCGWTNSFAGQNAYRVDPHPCQTDPTLPGSMQIYSQPNYQGGCATIVGDAWSASNFYQGYEFDSDLIQVNGWYSVWQQGNPPTEHSQFIRSFKIAPRTGVYMCQGPLGNSGLPCQYGEGKGISTGAATVSYPTVLTSGGLQFTAAAIRLAWTP